MGSEMARRVGNVLLEARSDRIPGQPDEESTYRVSASVAGGHLAREFVYTKPGSVQAALDRATREQWVIDRSGLSA